MTEEIDQLFDAYIKERFNGHIHTEGSRGVHSLEKICIDLGYRHGEFIGEHYIANFLADNPAAIEILFEYIRDRACNPYQTEWAEALDLQSYREADRHPHGCP